MQIRKCDMCQKTFKFPKCTKREYDRVFNKFKQEIPIVCPFCNERVNHIVKG